MADGNQSLKSGFYVRRVYDFSKAYAVAFDWWGSGSDELVNFVLETPTGYFVTTFPDGPAEFREVLLYWKSFNPTSLGADRPDKSRITGILWTIHSDGIRRLDLLRIYESPILRSIFIIRRSAIREIKGGFIIRRSAIREIKGGFTVRDAGSGNVLAGFTVNP